MMNYQADHETGIDERVNTYTQQVQMLFDSAPSAMIATVVNALVLAYIQWDLIPHHVTILWVASLYLITLIRLVHVYEYRARAISPEDAPDWGIWFTFGLSLSGVAWGMAGIFLYPQTSTTHQVFLAFVLGGWWPAPQEPFRSF